MSQVEIFLIVSKVEEITKGKRFAFVLRYPSRRENGLEVHKEDKLMKMIFIVIALSFFGMIESAHSDEQTQPVFDEEILSGVDRVKDRDVKPLEISSEADYVANEISVRQREPTQTQED
jgi:hypothetical protein